MTPLQERMDKILQEQEDGITITNPKDRVGTFVRKITYRLAVWREWIKSIFAGRRDARDR